MEKLTRERPKTGRKAVKHERLRSLPCIEEIEDRLAAGYPLPEVAKWLQEEKCECTDMSRKSLTTTLWRFKQDMPPLEIATPIPETAIKAREAVLEGIDELDELEALYRIQKGRVSRYANLEKAAPMPWASLNKDIMLAATILVRRHEIKMDLGMSGGRNLGTLSIRPELQAKVDQYDDNIKSAVQSAESRSKVLSLAKALVRASSEAE